MVSLCRSNSYQPTGSRVVVAGSSIGKSASVFPPVTNLSDIPAGKEISSLKPPNDRETIASKCPPQSHSYPSLGGPSPSPRTSSSSLASLGEECAFFSSLEMQSQQASNHPSTSSLLSSSLAATNGSPASPTSSRPASVAADKEILYAQLDLAPASTSGVLTRSSDYNGGDAADAPRSSAHFRPISAALVATDSLNTAAAAAATATPTTYVQIDFNRKNCSGSGNGSDALKHAPSATR